MKMISMKSLAGGAALALLIGGAAQAQDSIKIGVNEPLTGPFAASGTYVTNGARIAADEINAKGGVLGKKIELVIEDNKSNPTGLEPHPRLNAEAHGISGADAGRDVIVGQDYDVGQSLHFPHLATILRGSCGVQADGAEDGHQESRLPRHQQ
jgi:hypothetical protein